MYITKQMSEDFKEITYVPWSGNFVATLEYLSDVLAEIGYSMEIKKLP